MSSLIMKRPHHPPFPSNHGGNLFYIGLWVDHDEFNLEDMDIMTWWGVSHLFYSSEQILIVS